MIEESEMVEKNEVERLVNTSKDRAVFGMEYFLRNFSHVPDDRLTWVPTPTAKSALRIAAHTALYMERFARMIQDRKLPTVDNVDQWVAQNNAEEEAVSSRAEVEAIFRKGTEEVIAALGTLTPEDIGLTMHSGPEFSMEMTTLMNLPAWHCTLHAGQIDFLQTCWDDQVVHLAGK